MRGRRTLALPLAVLVLAVVAGGGALIATTGDDRAVADGEVRDVLAGIPQDGLRLGPSDAPVAITVYGDLLAPGYSEFFDESLVPVIRGPVRDGRAHVTFRHWNLLGMQTPLAAYAALAASRQDRYWHYLNALARTYDGVLGEWFRLGEALPEIARELRLDMPAWQRARADARWDVQLRDTARRARQLDLDSPPAYVVEGPQGRRVLKGIVPASEVERAIEAVS